MYKDAAKFNTRSMETAIRVDGVVKLPNNSRFWFKVDGPFVSLNISGSSMDSSRRSMDSFIFQRASLRDLINALQTIEKSLPKG